MVGVLHSQGHIGIRVIRETIMVSILEGGENGVCVNANGFGALPAIPFMVGAADGNTMGMVCQNDDEGVIAMFLRPFFCIFNGLIKFDSIVSSSLPIHDMELFINGSAFNHGKEAVGVLGQDIQRLLRHIHEVRLIIKSFQHLRVLQHFTVNVHIHGTGMEETQHRLIRRSCHHFLGIGDEGISQILEILDYIVIILSLGAGNRLRQITGRTAAHNDIGTMVSIQIALSQEILVCSSSGMADHGSRSRIGGLSLGNDTYRHTAGPFHDFRNIFYLRIIERILGGIFINTHGVHHRLMTGGIGGSRVGTVGDQGIITGSGNHCIVIQLFHSQKIIVLAVGHALGKDAGHLSGLKRHAVAYEKNDILRLLSSLFLDHFITGRSSGKSQTILYIHSDCDFTGLGEIHIINAVRSHSIAQILRDSLLAKELVRRNTVHLHIYRLKIPGIRHFYVKIKTGTCPELGIIYRKNPDIRCLRRKYTPKKGTSCQKTANCCFHPSFFHSFAPSIDAIITCISAFHHKDGLQRYRKDSVQEKKKRN